MSTTNPTSPTFSSPIAGSVLATGSLGTATTLDLKTKFGATLYGRIGRRVTTALTRSAYLLVRATLDDGVAHPNTQYDMVSSTAAGSAATTTSAGNSIGDTTVSVTSATGIAVGDCFCLSTSGGLRIEFGRVAALSGTTITLEEPLKLAHTSGDDFVTGADVFRAWIPGGDVYRLRAVNNSGQSLVMALDAAVYASDTTT